MDRDREGGSAGAKGQSSRSGSSGVVTNGVGPILAGSGIRGQRSRSQHRGERERLEGPDGGHAYPHTTPNRLHTHNGDKSLKRDRDPRQQGQSNATRPQPYLAVPQPQAPPFQPPHHQQQQQPPPGYSPSNTYPPRSSHHPLSPRHPHPDLSPGRDHHNHPDTYSEQLRKASTFNGGGGVGEQGAGNQGKPVPLPRSNVPGAMAVVKPTVMHQAPLAFMDI